MDANEVAILVKARDEATKVFNDVKSAGSGLGDTLGKVGQVAAGVFTAGALQEGLGVLKGAIGDTIAGFKEHMQVAAQTEAVLKSTGGAAGLSATEIEGMANALKANSTFADDAIQSGQNLLLTFTGIGKDVFPRATQTMVDMSQALGQDMKSSAVQLGKALNDPINGVTALSRVGVSFTDVQKDAIRSMQEGGDVAGAQALILAELEKEFGGSAKAASDAAGASEKYADRMDDLQDAIGEKLLPLQEKFKEAQVAVITFLVSVALPVIGRLAGWLGDKLAPALGDAAQAFGRARQFVQNFIGDVKWLLENGSEFNDTISTGVWQDLAKAVARVGEIVRDDVVPALTRVGEWLMKHKEVLAAAAIVIGTALVGAFVAWAAAAGAAAVATIAATAPVIAIGLAATALVTGIILLAKHWDELTARYPVLGQVSDEISSKFREFVGWITGTFVPAVASIATVIAEAVGAAVAFVREHWDEIRAVIEPALQALFIIVQATWKQISTEIEAVVGVIKGIVDVFMGVFTGDWQRAWDGVKEIVASVWNGIKETIENTIGLIRDLAPLILGAGKALGGALLDGLREALSATAGFAGDVGSAVLQAVKDVVNTQVIDRINRALEFSFDTHIPGVGTINIDPIDIRHLAQGGIVRARPGGTLAVIGEGGKDEAVIPLDRGMKREFGGGEAVYNFFAPVQAVLPNVRTAGDFMAELNRLAAY